MSNRQDLEEDKLSFGNVIRTIIPDWRAGIAAVLFLCLGVAVVFLEFRFPEPVSQQAHESLRSSILRHISTVFFVACLVTIIIDPVSRQQQRALVKQYIKEIWKNVHMALLGADVPKEVAEYVEEKFVTYPFLEEIRTIRFTLEIDREHIGKSPFGINMLRVIIEQEYDAVNKTNEKQKFTLSANIENILLDCLTKHHIGGERYGTTKVFVDGTEIRELTPSSDNRCVTHEFWIEAKNRSTIKIQQVRLRLEHDTELWLSYNTMQNLMLDVYAPDELLVCGIPINPSADNLRFENESGHIHKTLDPNDPRQKWLFPGQGFILWWRPRKWEEISKVA